jgi:hypothetical protein
MDNSIGNSGTVHWRESFEPKMCQYNSDSTRPDYYKAKGMECFDVIEAFGLGFNLGNVIKYVLRAGKKGNKIQDLQKAIVYLEREIGPTNES